MAETSPGYFIAGNTFTAPPLAPGLYVVATPIGNLRDITIRALETLAAAEAVLCEDTRMSARLLDHYGIKTRRIALHEHNERAKADDIVARIAAGATFALISDAGTPLLSDPGFPLIRAMAEAGQPVFPIPGASALLSALVVAGLPTDAFAFHGFLPPKAGARANAIKALGDSRETMVFYESPRRLDDTLAAMAEIFGERQAAVALELTKRYERVHRGTLAELAAIFAEGETKGEAVIVVAGAAAPSAPDAADWQAALLEEMADQPLRAAVDTVTARYGLKRKDVYNAALALKAEK
ncbi:16S rRNA (cytidine(1402)-2'-O)-methyltransferase [Devosia sp. J2-20]|jgi:16S rRNA (cytidine1402-2'-O)-methyltransferase|uniref:16S rRNA (cytidine(1402)-2'-O)-methyltransferase n=1 Tax=Devosia TaxID=46913 RepID=UPI0022B02A3B|nr:MULTISPECIES: 16S rRNA (cytidine(1402)-2'-O)-methyltransferase [Devosia]MCZ4347458.1 16S rRNA (cytidine(1402)-2'-O)-methyltransferase [Devosia neptuniae]WDR00163.1 16S rRNA (cytidine(1402)-2'-O)-methyltransferase [Devosia sp. J2-20]|tara:strand:+ start:51222 stop:52109 length:888 start_codon:yes stop_codon:yes gene_type:complete